MGLTNNSALTPFPYPTTPLGSGTPLTYREGITVLGLIEALKLWIEGTVASELHAAVEKAIEEFTAGLRNAENTIIQSKTEWQELFDDFMLNIANELEALNDEALQNLINNHTSKTYVALDNNFVSLIRGNHIYNLKSFPGNNDSDRFNAATTALSSLDVEVVLNISETLNLDKTIYPNLGKISYDFNGNTVNSSIADDVTIIFVTDNDEVEAMNRRFFKNLVLKGPGKTSAGSVGMRFYSDSPGNQNIRGVNIENAEILFFDVAMSFGRNSYLLTFNNGHTYQCGTCIRIEDKNFPNGTGDNRNYGENYRFFGWGFGSSNLGIYMGTNDLTDINMFGCSFDFLQGDGQKLCTVYSGQLHLFGAHIEFNGALPGPVIEVGPTYSAIVNIDGGRIQHNNVPAANVDYYFKSTNTYWGGGIFLTNVHMHYIFTTSGFLCDGPGQFVTNNLSFPSGREGSGFAMGHVLTSMKNNLLHDSGFTMPTNIDAVVTVGTSFTSTVESAQVKVINQNGKMVLQKKTVGEPCAIEFYVPIVAGKYYGNAFTLFSSSAATPATIKQNEIFAAVRTIDTRGVHSTLRTLSRGETKWNVLDIIGQRRVFGPAYEGPGLKGWNRQAPHWATHYIVRFGLTELGVGEYAFSEMVMTGA